MKVYKYICEDCGSEYISNDDVYECSDCGTECDCVSEGEHELLSESVRVLLLETGAVRIVYRDGKKVVVKVRKKVKSVATPAQREALVKARAKAHTPQAKKKRKKSMIARRNANLLNN